LIAAKDCKAYVIACLKERNRANISDRRASALLAMMTSFVILANQIERYEFIVTEEAIERIGNGGTELGE
jgi:hypothetical protein